MARPTKPIVFTARAERDGIDGDPNVKPDAALGDASFWGGVIMLGRAQVNNVVSGVNTGEGVVEGFPEQHRPRDLRWRHFAEQLRQ